MMWFAKASTRVDNAADITKADRTERLEIYKLMVEMADRVSQRRQAANSFYLSINTFLITASAFIGNSPTSGRTTWLVCLAGIAISALWMKAIASYKSLNENKFAVINSLETHLVSQPYSDEWARINPALHGRKHRPFHQTERIVPQIFIALFAVQALALLPWLHIVDGMTLIVYGEMD
jgi:hypothetical protein